MIPLTQEVQQVVGMDTDATRLGRTVAKIQIQRQKMGTCSCWRYFNSRRVLRYDDGVASLDQYVLFGVSASDDVLVIEWNPELVRAV
jgi:hypothetical protein